MERVETDVKDRVGDYEFTIVEGEPESDHETRWAQRSEKWAAWLMAQWKRHQRELAERN